MSDRRGLVLGPALIIALGAAALVAELRLPLAIVLCIGVLAAPAG